MFSTRNSNMEKPYNGPGKPTHHRADGTNYLMLKGDEYHNIWPVYDWQKISGTTIVQKPKLHPPEQIQKEGLTEFVGAVADGLYGAVAFDFISPHDSLKAKKSWFFFDHEYVCLGTHISSEQELPVATTINQVLMHSKVTVGRNGQAETLPKGNRALDRVKWVHQDKNGYVFPEPATINLSNGPQTGRWSDITDQKNISDALVSEEVFSIWFDHGTHPTNASYQTIVVPNVTVKELRETSEANRNILILSNTAELQAVKHLELGMSQISFFKAGTVKLNAGTEIEMSSHGMAIVKMDGGTIRELSVSDPSRKLKTIILTVSGIYDSGGEAFSTQPNRSKNSTTVTVDLPQGVYAGKSVTIAL